MIHNRWFFAGGIGLIAMGTGIYVLNHPAGDMFWEYPAWGLFLWALGVALLARGVRAGSE